MATRTRRKLHPIPSAVEHLNNAVTDKTLRQWIWQRKLEMVRIGGRVCIPEDVLDDLIERGQFLRRSSGKGASECLNIT